MTPKTSFLDRLIERLDELDPSSLQTYILRLVREKGFLETIFNTLREGVIVVGRNLKIQYANVAARSLLGLREDVAGQRIDRHLRDVDWGRVMDADAEQWQRISLQEIEVFYPTHRVLSFYLVPLSRDESDGRLRSLSSLALILHDVTGAVEDTEKTIESQKVQAITALAAGVAHEIGNPLNSLTIHLQLLAREIRHVDDEDLKENAGSLLDVALEEVRRLDAIVGNFLRAVRPAPPELHPIQIHELLSETIRFMKTEIEDRGILVQASWPETLPRIEGDAAQLRQAFYNLIRNAVQAMPEGGLLRVVCEEKEEFVEIAFADTGHGIAPENLVRIMEPYFTTKPGGTGLGMLIVERIIRNHGGQFTIESEVDKGTVFTLRLPLHERRVRLLEAPQP